MRKRLFPILFAICLASLVTGLVACGDTSEDPGKNENLKDEEKTDTEITVPEHEWDDGVITTKPTCITPGVITFTCDDCGATKKEIIDADGESHVYGDYERDETYHWQTCRLCGEVEKHEHDFSGSSKEDNVEKVLECECGIHATVGEYYAFKVNFVCDDGVSVLIYDSQDYSIDGVPSTVAYSRSKTGELLKDGEGQINFEVVTALGYKIKSITATPVSGYKNLKGEEETNRDNTYRITKITSDLTVYIETEIDALNLPVMVINTVNAAPILDKENYVDCQVTLLNAEDSYCFEEVVAGVRGRGNYTWSLDKKGYRIKFNKKQNVLGDYKCKSWVLLPNYTDKTLLRNYLAFSIAQEMSGLEWTPNSRLIEIYLNSEYLGVYLLTDQVQVNENRVNIEEGSLNVDTGYLIERDRYALTEDKVLGRDYFLVEEDYAKEYGYIPYVLKSPEYPSESDYNSEEEFEDAVAIYMAQFNYIKEYVTKAYRAIQLGDYEQFKELCDENSFVDYFLMDQIFLNWEIDRASRFYLYKDVGGKLFVGPVWDFDIAAGYLDPNPEQGYNLANPWFSPLLKTDFQNIAAAHLISHSEMIISKVENLDLIVSQNRLSIERNNLRWPIVYVYPMNPTLSSLTTYNEHIDFLKDFIIKRVNHLIGLYSS